MPYVASFEEILYILKTVTQKNYYWKPLLNSKNLSSLFPTISYIYTHF